LLASSYQVGIRETRHVEGGYTLTADDVLAGADFPDQIGRGAYPLDIHDVKPGKLVMNRNVEVRVSPITPCRNLTGFPHVAWWPPAYRQIARGRPLDLGDARGGGLDPRTGGVHGDGALRRYDGYIVRSERYIARDTRHSPLPGRTARARGDHRTGPAAATRLKTVRGGSLSIP
jgi:FAD dependent oxidoreductase